MCFSEIPLDRLARLNRHGTFGLGFTKDLIRSSGGAPVWYLWRDTPAHQAFKAVVRRHMVGGVEPDHPLWTLTAFVDSLGSGDWGRYEFDWEREWRHPGNLTFKYLDVKFLVCLGATDSFWHQKVIPMTWKHWSGGETIPPTFSLDWLEGELRAAPASA